NVEEPILTTMVCADVSRALTDEPSWGPTPFGRQLLRGLAALLCAHGLGVRVNGPRLLRPALCQRGGERAQHLGDPFTLLARQQHASTPGAIEQCPPLALHVARAHQIDLVEADDLDLLVEPAAVSGNLATHLEVSFADLVCRQAAVDEMEQDVATLRVPKEA